MKDFFKTGKLRAVAFLFLSAMFIIAAFILIIDSINNNKTATANAAGQITAAEDFKIVDGVCKGFTDSGLAKLIGGATDIVIPNKATSIAANAFYVGPPSYYDTSYNNTITSVTIPDSVTSIGSNAFYSCSGMTSLTIGRCVTSIYYDAFWGCGGLTSITVASGNPVYRSSGNCLIDIFSKTLILGSNNSVIPDDGSVTSIGQYAFNNCQGLTSISIPNSVTSVGYAAFSGCSNLSYNVYDNANYLGNDSNKYLILIKASSTSITSCNINDNAINISSYAFKDCTALTNITIPFGVTSIGSYAFQYCSGLTSITIPDSVMSISSFAFSGCTGLTSVTIPSSVTSIDSSAFNNCNKLTSITIPSSVTSIGSSAFENCTRLTEINYNAVNCSDMREGVFAKAGTSRSGITVNIGANVTKIPENMFSTNWYSNPPNLTAVNFADGSVCKSIGSSAFYKCTGLTSVTIPSSVTSIGSSAFSGCSALTTINVQSTSLTATHIGYLVNGNSATIIVPAPALTGVTTTYNQSYTVTPTGNYITNYMQVTYTGTSNSSVEYTHSTTKPTEAGTYTIAVEPKTTNTFTMELNGGNPTATLIIAKADYESTGFNDITVTYDGNEHRLSGNVPEGVTFTINYDGEEVEEFEACRNAGTYTYIVEFDGDYDNYNEIAAKTVVLTINKATIDLSGITLDSASFDYDDNAHLIAISGTLPEGVTVSYVYTKFGVELQPIDIKTVGEYTVTAYFTYNGEDKENFNEITEVRTALITIKEVVDPTPNPTPNPDGGLSAGAIIAIVIVCILVVAIAVVAVVIAASRGKVLVKIAGGNVSSDDDDDGFGDYYEE